MAKKLNLKNLILCIATVVCTVMSFVSIAFRFVSVSVCDGQSVSKQSLNLNECLDMINEAEKYNLNGVNTLKTARVFMIIALVVVAVVAVCAIVRLFIENKYLSLATLVASAVAAVLIIVFLILMFVGTKQLATANQDLMNTLAHGLVNYSYSILPHAAVYCVSLFGLGACATSIVSSTIK